jgi:hypothetical protein
LDLLLQCAPNLKSMSIVCRRFSSTTLLLDDPVVRMGDRAKGLQMVHIGAVDRDGGMLRYFLECGARDIILAAPSFVRGRVLNALWPGKVREVICGLGSMSVKFTQQNGHEESFEENASNSEFDAFLSNEYHYPAPPPRRVHGSSLSRRDVKSDPQLLACESRVRVHTGILSVTLQTSREILWDTAHSGLTSLAIHEAAFMALFDLASMQVPWPMPTAPRKPRLPQLATLTVWLSSCAEHRYRAATLPEDPYVGMFVRAGPPSAELRPYLPELKTLAISAGTSAAARTAGWAPGRTLNWRCRASADESLPPCACDAPYAIDLHALALFIADFELGEELETVRLCGLRVADGDPVAGLAALAHVAPNAVFEFEENRIPCEVTECDSQSCLDAGELFDALDGH